MSKWVGGRIRNNTIHSFHIDTVPASVNRLVSLSLCSHFVYYRLRFFFIYYKTMNKSHFMNDAKIDMATEWRSCVKAQYVRIHKFRLSARNGSDNKPQFGHAMPWPPNHSHMNEINLYVWTKDASYLRQWQIHLTFKCHFGEEIFGWSCTQHGGNHSELSRMLTISYLIWFVRIIAFDLKYARSRMAKP